jgi:putative transposase
VPNYRRAHVPGGTYFFTLVTYRRQPFLCDVDVRQALREGIRTVQTIEPFEIDAWVLLPDHLHCVWTLPAGDRDFPGRWAGIKRHVTRMCRRLHREDWMTNSKRRRKESTVWQRRYWEHLMTDENDYRCHVDYIHFNPVKHGLVPSVVKWPYSTFHRFVRQGIYPADWGGINLSAFTGMSFGE